MTVTIADVARHAGVSRSTVSYVLSGNRSISAETTRRVERSIKALGFRPHAGARSIRTRRTGVIAMGLPLVYGPHNQVQMPYVWAALTAAQECGLKMLMLTDDDGEAAIRDTVAGALVDGVILMEVQRRDPRIPLLAGLECPAVLVGTPDDPLGLPRTDFDFALAARGCADHLREAGHSAVGYLAQGPGAFERDIAYALHARESVMDALRSRGLHGEWAPCEPTTEGVVRALDDLLARSTRPTALIVYNERALTLVTDRLAGLGARVPQDISVIAICTDDEADRYDPPLTSVSLPAEELARTAVRLLARRIEGEELPSATLLAPALKVRGSTGPRRKRGPWAGPQHGPPDHSA
ncbi:LacI family DNA-binding transcriptional regulator [Actinacidiphila guanduensis]|uniref:Transcriptional regulator, LacI family n=1 Tax=Actinacidiphila guanduensis TaxID=310781 RepID=A0A1G9V1Y5_9ACTN|nr:LacI family DNA-binding transcriptional regulator [Actinacidiphila guanduensis]SDM66234.1 transcriptional regulator, LacI family [Actinacidiphila guanduensis]